MRWRILTAYTAPSFAVALPTIPVYMYLPTLYGIHLELGLTITGLVLLMARLVDTLSDPIVGILSDKFGYKNNHRKPWIAIGAVIAGIGLYRILNPIDNAGAFYLLTWSIILYIGWTMIAVPYLAWGAELSLDYHERTKITSCREGIGILGVLAAGIIIAIASSHGWSETESIGLLAETAIIIGAITIPCLLFFVPDSQINRNRNTEPQNENLIKSIKTLIDNKPFLRLLSAWFINGIANGIPAVLFFLYLENILGTTESQRAIYITLYFGSTVLAMPFWLHLSKLVGKHKIWCWAMSIAIVTFVSVIFIPEGSFIYFGIICVITGMCLGADLSLPPAIQADVVDYDTLKFRKQRAGLLFSLWGMSTKLALAISVGFAFPTLEILGFNADDPTEQGKIVLIVIYALIPVILKAIAVVIIWNFPLDAQRHDVIIRRLKRISDHGLNEIFITEATEKRNSYN